MALKINAFYDPGFSPIVKYIEAYEMLTGETIARD